MARAEPAVTDAASARRYALGEVGRALNRELYALAERPGLTWQQLHNRLQWARGPMRDLVATTCALRSRSGSAPWARERARARESGALVRTLTGHEREVVSCAVSPDGARLVSAGRDGVRVWDSATGAERNRFFPRTVTPSWSREKGFAAGVNACLFSLDGTEIIVADDGGVYRLHAGTGEPLGSLASGTRHDLALSPDGSWVVAAGDHDVTVSDVATGTTRLEIVGPTAAEDRYGAPAFWGCAVSPDSRWIVAAGYDGLLVFDARTGRKRLLITGAPRPASEVDDRLVPCRFYSCAVSPDGAWIVAAGDEGLGVWDPATGKRLRTFLDAAVAAEVQCAVGPDGTWVASTAVDGDIRLWDVATGERRRSLAGHAGAAVGIAISPDGTRIVTGGDDRTVRVWDPAGDDVAEIARCHTGAVSACAVGPDGTWVVSAGADATVRTWTAPTGEPLRVLSGHTDWVRGCVVSRDGRWIISAGWDGTVRVWEAASGAERHTLTGHRHPPDECSGDDVESWVNACAASPDSAWLVSAGNDGTLRTWSAASGKEMSTLRGHTNAAETCAVSPDGTWILSGSADGTLRVWDTATARERVRIEDPSGQVQSCAVSPDNTWVVSAGWNELTRWDRATGARVGTLTGHRGEVISCAVSPDGNWVVSVGTDDTLRVWEVASGSEVMTVPGPFRCVAVHPWRPFVVSGDEGGELHLLDLVGIEFGAIVVTVVPGRRGLWARCPACGQEHRVDEKHLGTVIACPTPACRLRLALNPFLRASASPPRRRRFLR